MSAAHPTAATPAWPCVLVTRPQPQADEWAARLVALGVAAVALPLMDIADVPDAAPVRAAWQDILADGAPPALVMFVSPSSVDRFFRLAPAGWAWPSATLAASTGPGTALALRAAGVPMAAVVSPDAAAGRFDSEALWSSLRPLRQWQGLRAWIVRGEGGRDWLADTLRQQGAQVHLVEAYRRTAPVPDAASLRSLQAAQAWPAVHWWLFSSSEAAGHLPALAPGADWSQARAMATHPRIAEAARRLGMRDVRLVQPSPEAVAALLRSVCTGP